LLDFDAHIPSLQAMPGAGAVPWGVQIQTVSGCNASCIMCPIGKKKAGVKEEQDFCRPSTHMDMELFKHIINSLEGTHVLALFLFNEPLLDMQLERRVDFVRQRWPDMALALSTNAALLTPERSRALFEAGITHLTVSLYTNDPQYYRELTGLDFEKVVGHLEAAVPPARQNGVMIRVKALNGLLRGGDESGLRERWEGQGITVDIGWLHDRAGNVRLRADQDALTGRAIGCLDRDRPWRALHVLSDGRVILCCSDYGSEHVLGNLTSQSVAEVWRSEAYQSLRESLESRKGPRPPLLCDRCAAAIRI